MTRGAVHEAFAAPGGSRPQSRADRSQGSRRQPIQEMPPDQKPAGQNVQWIPGYWSWDVSRNDYIWVSGIWREPPPNSQWVPGYWHEVEGGHQWVSGTWIPVSTSQNQAQSQQSYLPPPPASLEAGPNTPQPSPNVGWTPASGRGKRRVMPGGPGSGRPSSPTGSGCPPITSGHQAAISSCPDTGTCRWPTAA